MCGQLQEVWWLIKSLELWVEILFKVVEVIVWWQSVFFDYGFEVMYLLVLCEVVEEVGMYELIIFCVMMCKYIYMLCGIFEFKYFFFSGVFIEDGGSVLFMVIQVMLCKFVDVEDLCKLLFDQVFVEELYCKGIQVVCCIVVKYWEVMCIFSFSECQCVG